MAEPLRDPLADLRERLEATRDAAERIARETADAIGTEERGERPPPGYRTAEEREALRDDVSALASTLATLAELIPEELRAQLADILRQVLLLLRALIDWVVDRLPQAAAPEPAVRDIPLS